MKGLLVKDICLLMKQKTTLFIWFAMAVFFVLLNHDAAFGVGFSLILSSVLMVGTISYDDYDNGMGFLMTLPISKKTYVIEKYVLVLVGTLCVGLLVTCFGAAYTLIFQNGTEIGETLLTAGIMFCISLLYTGFMIPVQLKYGAEKGRIFMAIFAGVIFLLVTLVEKLEENINVRLAHLVLAENFGKLSLLVVLGIFALLAVAAELISMRISLGIIEKEEY